MSESKMPVSGRFVNRPYEGDLLERRLRLNLQLFAEGGDGGAGAAAPADAGQAAAPTETGEQIPAAGGKRARRKPDPFANVAFGIDESQQEGRIAASPSAPRNDGNPSSALRAPSPQGEGNPSSGAGAQGKGGDSSASPQNDKSEGRASFDELIKGEYKADFDARVQEIIGKRFKTAKAAEETLAKLEPMLDRLADRYGVQRGQDGSFDLDALIQAEGKDDAWLEEQAAEQGMSVDTFKMVYELQQEKARRDRQEAEDLEERQRRAAFENLVRQHEEAKKIYPGFDLRQELQNPAFVRLTGVGIDARTAYEIIHKDEIMGAGMQYAAQTAAAKVAASIASGQRRPTENGLGSANTGQTVRILDPKTLTKEQREEIKRRVRRGEKIVW